MSVQYVLPKTKKLNVLFPDIKEIKMPENLIQRTSSAYDYPLLIKSLLFTPIVNNPDQEIVYRDNLRISYAEFRRRVCRLANALISMGVKKGDTVGMMDFDSHRYLECFFAVPMIGAVLHTVNIKLSPSQISYTVNHAEDDFVFVNEEFLPFIEQIRAKLDSVKGYVVLSDDKSKPETTIPVIGEYEALLAAESDHYEFEDFDENTRATTFYTTGTTGMPKGVYFSHRQLVLHTLATLTTVSTVKSQGRFHRDDVYMPITPMFHVHAWGFPYIATFTGVKQVYPGKYSPGMLLQLIRDEGVTFSHCVPTILHLLMNDPAYEEIDLSHWTVVIGGSPLPRVLCRAFLDKGADIYAGYGLSETCPVLSMSHVDRKDLNRDEEVLVRCKAGRPLPMVDMRVVDEEMNELDHNEESVGEIVVRSPWLTQGYLKDKRNSEGLWKDGYMHTGDVGNIDKDHYLNITDRMKDVIKTGGEWVSSLELEDVLGIHPSVSEVAVIGMADVKWVERPLALVVKKGDVTEKELLRHIRGYTEKGLLTRQALLMKVIFIDFVDKTSVGKIDKKLLRKKYLSDEKI